MILLTVQTSESYEKGMKKTICELELYFGDAITRKIFSMCLSGLLREN